jgi:hypothetical protein
VDAGAPCLPVTSRLSGGLTSRMLYATSSLARWLRLRDALRSTTSSSNEDGGDLTFVISASRARLARPARSQRCVRKRPLPSRRDSPRHATRCRWGHWLHYDRFDEILNSLNAQLPIKPTATTIPGDTDTSLVPIRHYAPVRIELKGSTRGRGTFGTWWSSRPKASWQGGQDSTGASTTTRWSSVGTSAPATGVVGSRPRPPGYSSISRSQSWMPPCLCDCRPRQRCVMSRARQEWTRLRRDH